MALTSLLLIASAYFSFNPATTAITHPRSGTKKKNRGKGKKKNPRIKTVYKHNKVAKNANRQGECKPDKEEKNGDVLLGDKALTGGLQMVMTATPSLPTSTATRTDSIGSRCDSRNVRLYDFKSGASLERQQDDEQREEKSFRSARLRRDKSHRDN